LTEPIYKRNKEFLELLEEINKPIPNFKQIDQALSRVPPIIVSDAILDDVHFAYTIDYYLRYSSESTVKKILQNAFFSQSALIELFSVQMNTYHKAIIQEKKQMELLSSYWNYLTKAEYAVLFKNLLSQSNDIETIKDLLPKVDVLLLRIMTSTGSMPNERMLNFFKKIGDDIQKLAAKDMNLYDYAYDLANDLSDKEFLNYLDNYTNVFVQLRVVSGFVESVENIVRDSGNPPSYVEFMELCSTIPHDSLQAALEIFQEKNWLSSNEAISISDAYSKTK
jgi:hypothetical protein